jgi:hypothetical protein
MSNTSEPDEIKEIKEIKEEDSGSVLPGAAEVFPGSFWTRAGAVGLLGLAMAAILGTCLLSIVHHQKPQGISMGYVGPAAAQAQIAQKDGAVVDLVPYSSRAQAVRGIERMDDYGALVVTPAGTELLMSTSASPQVAIVLTQAFTPVTQKVTDVKPLPASDWWAAASPGFWKWSSEPGPSRSSTCAAWFRDSRRPPGAG